MNTFGLKGSGQGKTLLLLISVLALAGCTKRAPLNDVATASAEPEVKVQASDIDITKYASQIKQAIQTRIIDPDAWSGKSCDLAIKLNPDGSLAEVKTVGGDADFCRVAKSAIELAKIPAPPSKEVYERIKIATLVFKM